MTSEASVVLVHSSRFPQPKERADGLPLGVLHLAAVLRERQISVRIVDLNIEEFSPEVLRATRIVGISTTSYGIRNALRVSRIVREVSSEIPIIWGGVHPSLSPESTLEHPLVDGVLVGEADYGFARVCEHILAGGSVDTAPSLLVREARWKPSLAPTNRDFPHITAPSKGRIVTIQPSRHTPEIVDDLDTLPLLPYDMLNLTKYNTAVLDIHTARGCPYACKFCYNQETEYRSKSPERISREIDWGLSFFQAKILVFCEDMFFSQHTKVASVCESLMAKQLKLPWTANCRIESILGFDNGFWRVLRDSHCSLLKVGVESGSGKIQKLIGKGNITPEMVKEAVARCSDHGIGIKLNFIVGFPTESYQDIEATFRLIAECCRGRTRPSRVAVGVYDPYPGTSLWSLALRSGYDAPLDLDSWGEWRGELRRLRWLDAERGNAIRNLLFLTVPFDRPYANSVDGLWCRQPRLRKQWGRALWAIARKLIELDCLVRASCEGGLRHVPERSAFENAFGNIGLTSAPPSGVDIN